MQYQKEVQNMVDKLLASNPDADRAQNYREQSVTESRYGITISGAAKVIVIYGGDVEVRMDGAVVSQPARDDATP